ncbi:hypothetical protein [Cohnella sp.]|uniref:hypothetical protein n=1 Tax=Cohnella sp. TaxID=1883426 RepID=UPI003565215F
MRTVVVHFGETPQDWSLVERFFNLGISSGSLIFFHHQASRLSAYQELLDKVSEYLFYKMVDEWQLVWMINISQEKDFRERLSLQLDRFQQRFLDKLRVRRISPLKIFVIAFDDVDRHADGAPADPFLKQVWELDIQGCLPEKPSTNGNLFFEAEFVSIDREWRGPLDLKEAGPLEAPKPEFVHLLESRVSRIKECLRENILIPKRKLLDKYSKEEPSNIPTDILLETDLNAIEREFYNRVNQIPVAPLSPKLAEYKPSNDLKEVIKALIGIKASIISYVFIRVPYPQDFPAKRMKVLLKAAYVINAISVNSPSSRLWQEGNAYTIDVSFRETDLETLLSRWLTNLYIGKSKVENSLQNRRQEPAPEYGEWTSLPYGQATLKEIDLPRLHFTYKDRLLFDQEFRDFEHTARDFVKKREQQVVASAREGIRKLDVLKKLQEVPLHLGKEEPEAALRCIHAEAEEIREQLVRQVPHKPYSLPSWDNDMGSVKKDITDLLRSIPQARQIGWLSFMITTIMLAPYLIKWNEGSDASGHLFSLSSSFYPALVIVILLACIGLSRMRIGNAIKKRILNSHLRLDELMMEQTEAHRYDIEYLNKLYKLQKLTGRANYIEKFHQSKLRETMLLRYHQSEIQEAIDAGERLALLLGIQLRGVRDPTENTYDEQSWFEHDSLNHPVYSPLRKQNDTGPRGDEVTEMVFGPSKDTIRDSRLYPASRIHCEQDRVFRI